MKKKRRNIKQAKYSRYNRENFDVEIIITILYNILLTLNTIACGFKSIKNN